MKILAYTSYLGTFFNGWQRQKRGVRTVQNTIEKGLKKIYKKEIKIIGAGRTDAGVHALGQAFHFEAPFEIPQENLIYALNSNLPWDVKIHKVYWVSENFHARKNVSSKLYLYKIKIGKFLLPHEALTTTLLTYKLDLKKIEKSLNFFLGERDFYKFTVEPKNYKNTIRKIKRIDLKVKKNKIYLYFEGKGFLRYMIRRIVGTLIEVGRGKRDPNWLINLFDKEKSEEAGAPVEPKGLILLKVKYPKRFFNGQN